jgi:hypothetical protein
MGKPTLAYTGGTGASAARRRFSGFRTAVLEIGGVIAGTFELEAGSGKLLGESGFVAGRAFGEQGIAHFLHHILFKTTFSTFVGVDGHGRFQYEKLTNYINVFLYLAWPERFQAASANAFKRM